MTRRRFPLGAALVLVTAGFGLGQTPPTGQQVPVVPEVGPDTIRQLAGRLRAMSGANLPNGLLDQIRELQRQNPQATPQQLTDQLLKANPGLGQDPQQLAELQRFAQQFRGQFPPGQGAGLEGLRPEGMSQDGGLQRRPPGNPPPSFPRPEQPARPAEPPGTQAQPERQGNPSLPGTTAPPQGGRGFDPSGLRPPADVRPPDDMRLPNGRTWSGDPEQFRVRQQQFEQVKDVWERNIGPIESTPAVRQALSELFFNRQAMQAGDGAGPFGDVFKGAGGADAGRFAENALGRSGWKMPDLGLGRLKLSGFAEGFSAPDLPSGPSGPGFGGVSVPGGESWLSVILFGVVAGLALVLWWVWPKLTGAAREDGPRPLPGLGPWPVDPRTIADRDALVKAFEYLSVLRLGTAARVWNHVTIANVLRDAVPTADDVADPLARLYAVARYTPADEPIPPAAIAEARRHLCRLAGVPAA